jgi:hypothetical protein
MYSSRELATLRERAVQLRRQGKSRRQIKEILGIISNSTLNQLLQDEPLPPGHAREQRPRTHFVLPGLLDVADIPRSDLVFRLQIHETADVASAERFWLALTGARPEQFRKTSVKRHNPETTRRNTSDGYHGCLRIDVRRSCVLYRKIEGWASAATGVAAAPD